MTDPAEPDDAAIAAAAAQAAANATRPDSHLDPDVMRRVEQLPAGWVRRQLVRGNLPGEQGPRRGPAADRLHAKIAVTRGRPVPPNLSLEQIIFLATLTTQEGTDA